MTRQRPAVTCVKCGAAMPLPEEILRTGAGTLVCPACGQRYTRRSDRAQRLTTPSGGSITSTPQGSTHRLDPTSGTTPGTAQGAVGTGSTPATGSGRGSLPTAPIFAPDERVAGRYRIVRFLARGGMGEVYEAEDLELRGPVALKTMTGRVAREAGAVDRFRREIHLARRVTHPNVCRLFDVAHHIDPASGESIPFLTMELLLGETLTQRLRRVGKLGTAEALPIVRQLAAALGAAHEVGVIHRDLKSENIFLVPARDGGERAVVTDFGIARGGTEDRFAATLTSAGGMVGTPAYMAPEQVAGEPVTAAADQYALGVVMFEMVTGSLPFQGETPLTVAARRLTEPPPSPRLVQPELDPRWVATIERALARAPEDRFADVRELAAALAPESAAPVPSEPLRPPRRDRRQRLLAAALLIGLAGASLWAWQRVQAIRDRTAGLAPAMSRRAVAVLGLRNLAGRPDSAWVGTALSEMLATELGQAGGLRVVPGDAVAGALSDLGLAGRESIDGAAAARLRERLAADLFVLGGYTALGSGGPLRLDLRLQDARSSESLLTVAESGSEAELFDMVGRVGSKLRERLGATAPARVARPRLPGTPEAARAYAEGLEALRRFEPQRGRELLEQAVVADPDNALARSALAGAWADLGYGERAEQEARRAFESAGGLSEEERGVVEARYLELARQWGRAAELWQRLWSAYPDILDYGLRLAHCRTQEGQVEAALAVTATLRTLPPPEGESPRIDLAEAAAAAAVSDFRRQSEAAGRAAERAAQVGARRIEADALVARAWAMRNLGQSEEAVTAADRAGRLYAEAGDRAGAASASTVAAAVRLDQGELGQARELYQAALETWREIGDQGGVARTLNNLAVVLRNLGELEAARVNYEQVETICRETGDRLGGAYAATNVAAILADLGDLRAASGRLEPVIALWRELGDQAGLANALGSQGNIRRRQGELAAAESALVESLEVRRRIGQRIGEIGSLNGLAAVALDRGDLEAARSRFEEAAVLARELDAKSGLAAALQGLGEVAAARGGPATATELLGESLAVREAIGERAGAGRSRLALARLDLERQPAAALSAARAVADDPIAGQVREIAISARLLAARAEGALSRTASARAELENVVRDAEAAGLLPLELEARLELALLAGDSAARAAVAERARAAGLARLVERASLRPMGAAGASR